MKTQEEIKQDAINIISIRFNEQDGYHKTIFLEAYTLGYNKAVLDVSRQNIFRRILEKIGIDI